MNITRVKTWIVTSAVLWACAGFLQAAPAKLHARLGAGLSAGSADMTIGPHVHFSLGYTFKPAFIFSTEIAYYKAPGVDFNDSRFTTSSLSTTAVLGILTWRRPTNKFFVTAGGGAGFWYESESRNPLTIYPEKKGTYLAATIGIGIQGKSAYLMFRPIYIAGFADTAYLPASLGMVI